MPFPFSRPSSGLQHASQNSNAENSGNTTGNLADLYALTAQFQKQLTEYLLKHEAENHTSTSGGLTPRVLNDALAPLEERLDGIGAILDTLFSEGMPSSISPGSGTASFTKGNITSDELQNLLGLMVTKINQHITESSQQVCETVLNSLASGVTALPYNQQANSENSVFTGSAVHAEIIPNTSNSSDPSSFSYSDSSEKTSSVNGGSPCDISSEMPAGGYVHYEQGNSSEASCSAPNSPTPEPGDTSRNRSSSRDNNSAWGHVIWGPWLSEHPVIKDTCQELLYGVLHDNKAARNFAGALLSFQSAPPEKMVLLIKELGESFYRWHPKHDSRDSAIEVVMCEWIQMMCENNGLQNRVELVHVGERFDSSRHNATSRGVEITQVLGWIVLRGNGSVYAKAAVNVI